MRVRMRIGAQWKQASDPSGVSGRDRTGAKCVSRRAGDRASRVHVARPRCQLPSVPSAGRLLRCAAPSGEIARRQSLPVGYDGKGQKRAATRKGTDSVSLPLLVF